MMEGKEEQLGIMFEKDFELAAQKAVEIATSNSERRKNFNIWSL